MRLALPAFAGDRFIVNRVRAIHLNLARPCVPGCLAPHFFLKTFIEYRGECSRAHKGELGFVYMPAA